MKKFVAVVLSAVVLFTCCACSAMACCSEHLEYMRLTKIVSVEDKTDYSNPDFDDYEILITSLATDGNLWQWWSDDTSWNVGDYVILHLVDENDTADITDDVVCCVEWVENPNFGF